MLSHEASLHGAPFKVPSSNVIASEARQSQHHIKFLHFVQDDEPAQKKTQAVMLGFCGFLIVFKILRYF